MFTEIPINLDCEECAPVLIQKWLQETRNPNLIFRIAVRGAESWVLADRLEFAKFLGISQNKMPKKPDDLPDPKAHLINLARASRKRAIREDIVLKTGSTAKQGPAYNERLVSFVKATWNPSTASQFSPSLERTLKAIEAFAPTWPQRNENEKRAKRQRKHLAEDVEVKGHIKK